MSDSNNHSSATHDCNRANRWATNPPANPAITSSTQPRPSASGIGPDAVNGGTLRGNHQAQRTTPPDDSRDHQARDTTLHEQNGTPPTAVMTVEYTGDPTVREIHDALHSEVLRSSGVPFTLASSVARELTARDRQELGLPPDTSRPEGASSNNQSTTSGPDGSDLFESPSSAIPPVAVTDTAVALDVSRNNHLTSSGALQSDPPQANSSESLRVSHTADSTAVGFRASGSLSHPMRRSVPPSRAAALSSHPLREASDTATVFYSAPSINRGSGDSNQRPSYSLTDLGLRGEPFLDHGNSSLPDLHTCIPDTTVNSGPDYTDGQADHRNGGDVENGNGRGEIRLGTPMDTPPSVNVSDLRLGPVSDETLITLALLSRYPGDELRRATSDEAHTASRSVTPVGHRDFGPRFGGEHADHSDDSVPARPNTPIHPRTTNTLPPSDPASHHQVRNSGSPDLLHGSTLDSRIRDSTPRDEGHGTRLSDYLPTSSPSAEDREAWAGGSSAASENAMRNHRSSSNAWRNTDQATAVNTSTTTPENEGSPAYLGDHMEEPSPEERRRLVRAIPATQAEGTTGLDLPPNSSNMNGLQDYASSAINRSIGNRARRAPGIVGSLRRTDGEEFETFWDEDDDSRND